MQELMFNECLEVMFEKENQTFDTRFQDNC